MIQDSDTPAHATTVPDAPPSVRRLRLLAAGVAAVAIVVTLGLCEIGLRMVDPGTRLGMELRSRDPAAIQIEPLGLFGYRQKPGARYRYANGSVATANALGYRGPLVTVPKPKGVFRIVLLGGSTTHGWGVPDSATIDEAMRRQLRAERPDLRIEVVNLAFDGYDAFQLLQRLRLEALRYAPDVVIVNEGINDVRNARFTDLKDIDERTLIWASELRRLRAERNRGGPTFWNRIKHALYVARLPALARDLVTRRSTTTEARRIVPTMAAADNFERNLVRIVRHASAARVPVLFSTPPSSLGLRYRPDTMVRRGYFVVDNATTQAYRDTLAARMRGVVERLAGQGMDVAYVPGIAVPREEFLDDAHLTAAGNARLAAAFVEAVRPRLPRPPQPPPRR